MRFVDTNVLLYAISGNPDEQEKAQVAEQLLQATDLAVSVQVLQEFYVQATRAKGSPRLAHEEATAFIATWLRFAVADMTVDLMRAAIDTSVRFHLSYWDSAIIAAARVLGCSEVLTEDLNDGQNYGGIRARNPFRTRSKRYRRT